MGNARREVIAIVDDDEAARHALGYLLDALGQSTESFSSAAGFLAAGPGNFGCLILDQHMPVMTGLQLAKQLRSAQIAIPIMLTSGNLTGDIADMAAALGIKTVTEKPLDLDELTAFLDDSMK